MSQTCLNMFLVEDFTAQPNWLEVAPSQLNWQLLYKVQDSGRTAQIP